jgi:pSer/pThr/pTyr-binding forkhead associated (FHA) protein
MIHLLTIPRAEGAKTEFKIGRGHESEVRINDISVSRCHAMIKFVAGDGFYIEDNQSKFGTIVLLKERIQIQNNHSLAV